MCKLAIITHAPRVQDLAKLRALAAVIGTTERDGYGCAVTTAAGVKSRRWTSPADFRGLGVKTPRIPGIDARSTAPVTDAITGPSIWHGRTATSETGLANAHPMDVQQGTHGRLLLCHNGVVDTEDDALLAAAETGCDSEYLALSLARGGLSDVLRSVSGYYAFGAIMADGSLVICRDAQASLVCGRAPWGGYAYATNAGVLSALGVADSYPVRKGYYVRLTCLPDGRVKTIEERTFSESDKAKGKAVSAADYRRSIGGTVPDYWRDPKPRYCSSTSDAAPAKDILGMTNEQWEAWQAAQEGGL